MEPIDALKQAITAWRKCKDPRFALIAEWATARALPEPRPLVGDSGRAADAEAWLALYEKKDLLDVPRLIATIGSGKSALAVERMTLLSKLDDPRVVTGLFGWLEKPPYSARTAMPFFRTAAQLIAESGDRRARSGLEDLAQRYKAIVSTTVGDDFAAAFRRVAGELDQVKPGPLPAALEKKAQELEALFEKEGATASRQKASGAKHQQSDDAFLDAIYDAPDDDAPRLVFADALTERGDLRGEFISLQLARAKGAATPEGLKRERELCRDAKRRAEWSLPLSQGGEAKFSRGFPVDLQLDPRSFKTIVGLRALRTVTTVDGFSRSPPIKHSNAFLFHPNALHLKGAGDFDRKLFDALTGPMNWETAGLAFAPTRTDLERLPNLKHLELRLPWREPRLTQELPALQKLESLRCMGAPPEGQDFWGQLTNVTSLHLYGRLVDAALRLALSPLSKLTSLSLEFTPEAPFEALQLPRVEKLRVPVQVDTPWAALLSGLPALRELDVSNVTSARDASPVLALGAKRLSALRRLTLGAFHFFEPFTARGVLVVRHWGLFGSEHETIVNVLASIPDGCVTRVVLRPSKEDPTAYAPVEPTAEQVATVRAKVPVQVEWY